MKAFRFAMLALAAMGCAVAQDVPPPPRPKDEGPSLEVTMKFLQEKLPGQVNYIVYFHDDVVGTDCTNKRSQGVSNVAADAGRCHVGYHLRYIREGETLADNDLGIPLKEVQDIVVMPLEQSLKAANAKNGHPEWSSRVDPPVFLLLPKGWSRGGGFLFDDETLSHRVAKALQHAVELCGGGNQEPF